MTKNKLFSTLKTLSKSELTEFSRFVTFNDVKLLSYQSKLIKYIVPFYPTFDSKKLEKEKLFQHLYPGKKYNESKLNDIQSKLVKLCYEYLSFRNYKSNTNTVQKHLLAELDKRDLKNEFETLDRKHQPNSIFRDANYFQEQLEIATVRDNFYEKGTAQQQGLALNNKLENLDIFYLSSKLRSYWKMLNWQNINPGTNNTILIEEIINYLEQENNIYKEVPNISCYYQLVKLLTSDTKEVPYLENLLTLLSNFNTIFPESELKEMYTVGANYCIKQINNGNSQYLQKLFSIYNQMIEENLFYEDGYLSQWKFMNMCTIALRLNEIEWTQKFIEKHIHGLKEEEQENAYAYNLASYHFKMKEYDKATTLLNEVEFSEQKYVPVAKSLLLKIYFETKETFSFPYHSEAFKKYIQRHKNMTDNTKETYLNFIKYSERLFDLIYLKSPILNKKEQSEKLNKLHNEMESKKNMQNSTWLLEMIESIT